MLAELKIENYALIDSVSLEYEDGLTIITGETGAGKSIMLDALSLIMGARADSKVVGPSGQKAVVEARFINLSDDIRPLIQDNGYEWSNEELIIRREISSSGRSRAFVNDSPATLQLINQIASRLVDIHSQHSNLLLTQNAGQLAIIDAFAEDAEIIEDYKKDFRRFSNLRSKIIRLRAEVEEAKKNQDFIAFRLRQLDKLNPRHGELEEVERQFDLLSDADEIRSSLGFAYGLLEENDVSALSLVAQSLDSLSRLPETFFPSDEEGNTPVNRLSQLCVELKDIAGSIGDSLERVHSNPQVLARLSERMNILYDAQKSFNVPDHEALVALHESLKRSLSTAEQSDHNIAVLETEARALGETLKAKAETISRIRADAASDFSKLLCETARPLGLHNLNFEVKISQGKLSIDGRDHVEFVCAFNKNQPLRPITEIASGGEMSRLMLSIKGIMTGKINLPTIIFDEVDTGVSGEIADKMGRMMVDMGDSIQVIAITHLPQVAAKGKIHFKVYKRDEEDRTITHVEKLDYENRVIELANMLSGSERSEASLANARELLSAAKPSD